jgi:predicted RNase H-like nuclease (RuvC/YqgF family)
MNPQKSNDFNSQAEENRKQSNSLKVLTVLVVILVIAIGFLIYSNMQLRNEVEDQSSKIVTKDSEVVQKTKELDELRLEFERVREEREALGLNNDSLNLQIQQLDKTISELRRTGSLNQQKRRELESLVASLRSDLAEKDAQIAALTSERDTLRRNVEVLEGERTMLRDTISTLSSTRERLQGKVDIASILKAENVKVSVINKRGGKEKDSKRFRAKNIDKVKVTFTLNENKVTDPGSKEVMISVIDPSGATLYDLANGGGIFDAEGKKAYYSVKQSVDYNNARQDVSVLYDKGIPFEEGKHIVEIYVEGHKIGESSFDVK